VIVDRAWVERNIGLDPGKVSIPASAFALRAAAGQNASLDDIQRDVIDFDSEGPEGAAFFKFTKSTGLSRFIDIPWPKGLAPTPAAHAPGSGGGPLPQADVLAVTWTMDEGHALSRVLTPGKDSNTDYVPYTHNFATLSRQMSKGSPVVEAKRLGKFWTTTIGATKLVVFKSDSHLSQDTDKHFPADGQLPNAELWKQIIGEVQPKLVLTTGTAGGIGKQFEVGDVIVSSVVRFDSQNWLKKGALRQCALSEQKREHHVLFAGHRPLQSERVAAAVRQQASAGDHRRRPNGSLRLRRHDRLLRLRHNGQSLQASRSGRRFGDGRRRARDGRPVAWVERAGLACDPQRLRPADRRDRAHAQAAGQHGCDNLQGLWALELCLQRHRLLGSGGRSLRLLSALPAPCLRGVRMQARPAKTFALEPRSQRAGVSEARWREARLPRLARPRARAGACGRDSWIAASLRSSR
jgi:hypothetical protein